MGISKFLMMKKCLLVVALALALMSAQTEGVTVFGYGSHALQPCLVTVDVESGAVTNLFNKSLPVDIPSWDFRVVTSGKFFVVPPTIITLDPTFAMNDIPTEPSVGDYVALSSEIRPGVVSVVSVPGDGGLGKLHLKELDLTTGQVTKVASGKVSNILDPTSAVWASDQSAWYVSYGIEDMARLDANGVEMFTVTGHNISALAYSTNRGLIGFEAAVNLYEGGKHAGIISAQGETATFTPIGYTQPDTLTSATSAVVDDANDVLYISLWDKITSSLYALDLSSSTQTKIAPLPYTYDLRIGIVE